MENSQTQINSTYKSMIYSFVGQTNFASKFISFAIFKPEFHHGYPWTPDTNSLGQLHWDLAQCIETIVTPRVEGLHLFTIYTPGVVMSYVAFSLRTLHRSTLRQLIGEGAVRPVRGTGLHTS